MKEKNEKKSDQSRVVVIGAHGFVGKHLMQALAQASIPALGLGRAEVDLTDPQAVARLTKLLQPEDSVVFLSAITPDKGKSRLDFQKNIHMGMAVCDALDKVGPSQLIYFSSDAVYRMENQPVDETTPCAPQDLYGTMHRARELLCGSLNLPLWILRPTLIYGIGDTHGSYGPNRFLKQALTSREIILFGEGEEKRSHVSVHDVVAVLIQGLQQAKTGVLNVATEPSLSFQEVASLIQENLPFSVTIKRAPRGSGPITHRHYVLDQLYDRFPTLSLVPPQKGIASLVKQSLRENAHA